MIIIARNKTEAKKAIKNYVKSTNSRPFDFDQINLNRKYPTIVRLSGFDSSNFNGGLDTLVYFHPLTKEIKRRVMESLL